MNVLNLGLHGGLPLEFYFSIANQYAAPNDIIIMPLEYAYYHRDNEFNIWQIKNLSTWGTEYIKFFNSYQKIKLILQTIPTYTSRLTNPQFQLPIRDFQTYIQNKNIHGILSKKYNYAEAINCYGDILFDFKTKLDTNFSYIYIYESNLKDFTFKQLQRFADEAKQKKISVLITYPVSIKNPLFDLQSKNKPHNLNVLEKKLKKYNLKLIGQPELSNFDPKYSLDTEYHLNAEGSILHTLYLADSINAYLAGKKQDIDFQQYTQQKKQEAQLYLENYRKLGFFSE